MFFKYPDNSQKFLEYDGMKFEIVRRNVRYFRVEFSRTIPMIILPPGSRPERILKENFGRIQKKYKQYLDLYKKAGCLDFINRDVNSFDELISNYLEIYSNELQVNFTEVKFRKMRRMWGNCRNNGVVTLNSRLFRMPEKIISYIIYHELLHLAEKGGHSVKFRRRMREKFPDQKLIESDLRAYFVKFDIEDVK